MYVARHAGLALAALALAAAPALAGTDQADSATGTPSFLVSNYSFIGESFTPSQSSLNFVTLNFTNNSANTSNGRVTILSGSGPGGAVQGTSSVTSITGGTGNSNVPFTFTFAVPVALTPGQSYTIQFQDSANNPFLFLDGSGGNPYASGLSYAVSGGSNFASANYDFQFQEGTQATSTPEPSSVAAFGLTFLGAGGLMFKARRRKALPAA